MWICKNLIIIIYLFAKVNERVPSSGFDRASGACSANAFQHWM